MSSGEHSSDPTRWRAPMASDPWAQPPPVPFLATPRERLLAWLSRKTLVETRSLEHQPGLMLTNLRRPIARACAFFLPPMTLAIGGLTAYELLRGKIEPWQAAIVLVVGLSLTFGLSWRAAVVTSTYGVAVLDQGILVFERAVKRGSVLRWPMLWDDMRVVTAPPGIIWLAVGPSGPRVSGTSLSYEQARVILTHPRCPLRNSLPAEVAERIGVEIKANPNADT
jgi:hypothetical protein